MGFRVSRSCTPCSRGGEYYTLKGAFSRALLLQILRGAAPTIITEILIFTKIKPVYRLPSAVGRFFSFHSFHPFHPFPHFPISPFPQSLLPIPYSLQTNMFSS